MAKILVVDDAAFMRLSLRTMLAKNGHEVVGEAENGRLAVDRYREFKPDLVTMDITMPDMDGIRAVKEILKLDPKAKILMISALGQEAMVREAVVSGARGFLVKPFLEEALVKAVSKMI